MTYLINYINSQDQEVEITVNVDYSSYYDGIGYYEYGSERCFDKGELCIEINTIEYNKSDLSGVDIAAIDREIEENNESIINACLQDIKDSKEAAAERDYDDLKAY